MNRTRLTAILLIASAIVMLAVSLPSAENVGGNAIQTKTYDISHIIGPNTVKVPILGWAVNYREEPFTYHVDDLMETDDVIDLLYNETGTDNWGPETGAFITSAGSQRINVRNKLAILQQVDAIIQRMTPKRLTYNLSISMFTVPAEMAIALRGINFNDYIEVLESYSKFPTIYSGNMNIRPNRTTLIGQVYHKKYVADFSARLAAMAVGYETITDEISFGQTFLVKLTEVANGVSLHLKLDSWNLMRMEQMQTTAGTLEKPELLNYFHEDYIDFVNNDFYVTNYIVSGSHFAVLLSLK